MRNFAHAYFLWLHYSSINYRIVMCVRIFYTIKRVVHISSHIEKGSIREERYYTPLWSRERFQSLFLLGEKTGLPSLLQLRDCSSFLSESTLK